MFQKIIGYGVGRWFITANNEPSMAPILFFKKKEDALLRVESFIQDECERHNYDIIRQEDVFGLPQYSMYDVNGELNGQIFACAVFDWVKNNRR